VTQTEQTVLVTGGAGYIGSHAVLSLIESGYRIVILDNLIYGHSDLVKDLPNVHFFDGDVSDQSLVKNILTDFQADAVMHFAAYAYVGESVTDPAKYYLNNVVGTLGLLEAMRAADVKRMIFSSTCATYGNPKTLPIAEDHPQSPINPYGSSKLMVERILKDYDEAYQIRSVIFRYFNAAGADPLGRSGEDHTPETHLIPLMLDVALGKRAAIKIFGDDYPTTDGTCLRDYIHVSDLADAHVLGLGHLMKRDKSAVFNLGTSHGFSVREILDVVREITGHKVPAEVVARREGDPAILLANPEKSKEILGWTPKHSDIREIIEHAWKWHRTRHKQ
jgi:UDP-glucose 4-epimerase